MTPSNIARMCMLGGIDIAALTDHNSTANCPAFFKACEKAGVVPVAGCEVNTAEEVHVLCLFPELEAAMDFGERLRGHMPDIANDAEVFGRQVLMDEYDREIGEEGRLLIAAVDISIDDISGLALAYGGAAVPAHIDRPAFSLLYNLGFIPEGYPFAAYEISPAGMGSIEELMDANPALRCKTLISDSDAHTLADLVRDAAAMRLYEPIASAVCDALSGRT
jgi:PHP family Zn ribbon phosphoesterase